MKDEDNVFADPSMEPIRDAPMTTSMAIAAISLNMAMKYHDFTVVKDGVMYQQLKMEQKEMRTIQFEDVLETADRIRDYLIESESVIRSMMTESVMNVLERIAEDPDCIKPEQNDEL